MRRSATSFYTILLVTAVVLLALYAMGALDGAGILYVRNMEHNSGDFSFSGGVKDGLFSGSGMLSYANGAAFTVGFDEGRFSGDGAFYSGGGGNRNDWHFYGAFSDGRTDGGTFYFADGYKVDFSRDQATVTLTGSSWRYSGSLSELGQNGDGSFTFEDGFVYSGGFLNGLADGVGEYKDPGGRVIYSGEFSGGFFDGQGIYYSHEGWTYEGSFKNGLFDGDGVVRYDDFVVHGLWKEGVQIERHD